MRLKSGRENVGRELLERAQSGGATPLWAEHIGRDQHEVNIVAETNPPRNHSIGAQAQRLILRLREGPVTTIEAAKELDIIQPPSVVRYLREKGYRIATHWVYGVTDDGRVPHRIGKYVLLAEAA
ncbi:helix-turn-helix domain-containing protein [Pseudomonas pseudonitroreducens]|nr:helix-turn-helix domain-containing protein [Pseudomonas pseudonitroreducens]